LPSLAVPVGLFGIVALVPIGGPCVQMRVEGSLVPISMAHGAWDGGVPLAIKPSVSIIALPWARFPRSVGAVVWLRCGRVTCPLELVSELLLIGIPGRWRLTEAMH
jgi:hypothetical protein